MKQSLLSRGVHATCAAAVGFAASGNAVGQAGANALEEIVVTATRREASLQDVPISIVAMSSDDLEMQGIDTIEGLQGTIPNLNIIGGTNGGVSSVNFSVRGIPRVGFYVDGIWQPYSSGMMELSVEDIERVEVLRGPQGTLYGRDSTGGAIRVITRGPADDFGGTGSVALGTFNRRDATVAIDVPLTETLKTRFSAASLQRDGYVTSVSTDQKMGQVDMQDLIADITWKPSDRFSLRAKYNDRESHPTDARLSFWAIPFGANLVNFAYGALDLYTLAGAPYTPESAVVEFPGGRLGEWQSSARDIEPATIETSQASIDISYDLTDNITLQSWTGYINHYQQSLIDWDNSEWIVVEVNQYNKQRLFSQELQLSGTRGRFDWVGGVYYWKESALTRSPWWGFHEFKDGTLDPNALLATPECMAPTTLAPCSASLGVYMGLGNNDPIGGSREDGFAIFGEFVTELTDAMNLTFGVRYHEQDLENFTLAHIPGVTVTKPFYPGNLVGDNIYAGTVSNLDAVHFDAVTTRIALNRDFSDSVMGYVSYAEGFNAGGASPVTALSQRYLIPFDPEDIATYEVGIRSDLAGGRVRLNATLFHTDWEDIQIRSNYVDPSIGLYAITIITQNVAGADADGIEAELRWLATDNLELDVNVGLLDTKYTTFLQGDQTPVNSGDAFAQAPELTYSVGLQHSASLSNGASLVSRVDYSYVGGFQRYADPKYHPDFLGTESFLGEYEAGEYGILNARIAYEPPGGNWEVAVFGTNLLDEYVINGGFYGSIWELDWSTVGRPREAGVQMRVFFE
jgi:iron complex outermembrane receptor protein